jgi:flavorubredoxin
LFYQAAKYYANILLLYSTLIQKLLASLTEMGIEIDMIAPDHGLIWRSNVSKIIESYSQWCRQVAADKALVVYDTMWHSTEMMAKAVAEGIEAEGVNVKVMNLADCHRSDIITELLDAKAIALGSATLNNGMLPRMADLLCYMKGLRPLGKIAAVFGSYGWGGEAVKLLGAALDEMKFEVIDLGVRINYVPGEEDLKQCVELGHKLGKAVKEAE